MKLSLALIVKNEEEKLARCLSSVKEYVDELVVVDTGSQDRTKEIAASFGAQIYDFAWCNDFAKARNFSIEKTSGDYVLTMDADSFITSFDCDRVRRFMDGHKAVGLAEITNSFIDNGQRMRDQFYAGVLFPREARYVSPIHEQIDPSYPRERLPISIFHDGYENRSAAKSERNIGILERVLKERHDPYLSYKLAQEYRGIDQLEKADRRFASAYKHAPRAAAFYSGLVAEYIRNLIQLKEYEEALEVASREERHFSDCPEFHFVCGGLYTELVLSNPQKYIQYFSKIKTSYERSIAIGENPRYSGIIGMGSFLPTHNLGAFYEVIGDIARAKECYKAAVEMGYEPSKKRLGEIASKG